MRTKRLAILLIALIATIHTGFMTFASDYPEPQLKRVTCYHYNSGITASGTIPKQGRTVGARREDIGKACILYEQAEDGSVGDMIGIFVIEDTGNHPRLQNGSIDVYRNTYEDCKDWVSQYGDYIYVSVIEAKG